MEKISSLIHHQKDVFCKETLSSTTVRFKMVKANRDVQFRENNITYYAVQRPVFVEKYDNILDVDQIKKIHPCTFVQCT